MTLAWVVAVDLTVVCVAHHSLQALLCYFGASLGLNLRLHDPALLASQSSEILLVLLFPLLGVDIVCGAEASPVVVDGPVVVVVVLSWPGAAMLLNAMSASFRACARMTDHVDATHGLGLEAAETAPGDGEPPGRIAVAASPCPRGGLARGRSCWGIARVGQHFGRWCFENSRGNFHDSRKMYSI